MATRLPNTFLEEIKGRVSLPALIGRHTALKRHGREFLGLCPFHKERTPSFHVYEGADPHYHCFGCGAHGDAISFLTDHEGLDFMEAVERLAAEAGMAMPVSTPEERAKEARKAGLYEVVEAVCTWYQAQLFTPAGAKALEYLRGRGLSDTTIAAFRLGYAPEGSDGLMRAVEAVGGTLEQAVEAGAMRLRDGPGSGAYAFLRDRVIFPILDRKGRPIAFGGRFLGDHKAANTGKYMNSPETPLFDKGRTLFNADKARPAARREDRLLVAEGYMDVIALAQAGIEATVAPLGTALGEDQIAELWRIVDAPILCFDGDQAGRNAAARAAERALAVIKPDKTLRFAFMPEGEDPDSLIRAAGPEAVEALLAAPVALEAMLWRAVGAGFNLAEAHGKAASEKAILDLCQRIENAIVRRHLSEGMRERMWAEIRALRDASRPRWTGPGRRAGQGPQRPPSPEGSLRAASGARRRRADQAVLVLLARHPELLSAHEETLAGLELDPALDKFRMALQNAWSEWGGLDSASWRDHFLTELAPELRTILDDRSLRDMFPQTQADSSLAEAGALLEHLFGQHVEERQRAEMREVGRRAAMEADQAAAHGRVLAMAELLTAPGGADATEPAGEDR